MRMEYFKILFPYVLVLFILVILIYLLSHFGIFKKKSTFIIPRDVKQANFELELARSLSGIKEETLQYIKYELQNEVAQKLSVVRLLISRISYSANVDRPKIVDEIYLITGECIRDIRNISAACVNQHAEQASFFELLQSEIMKIKRTTLREIDLSINANTLELDREHGIILFRLTQELLALVVESSGEKIICIKVNDSERLTEIIIEAAELKFQRIMQKFGQKFRNMAKRAELINTDIKTTALAPAGTQISVTYNKQGTWKKSKLQS